MTSSGENETVLGEVPERLLSGDRAARYNWTGRQGMAHFSYSRAAMAAGIVPKSVAVPDHLPSF
jgi:hypothetical protein